MAHASPQRQPKLASHPNRIGRHHGNGRTSSSRRIARHRRTLAAVLAIFMPRSALGHAGLTVSSPPSGAALVVTPSEFYLSFNHPIDLS